MDERRFCVLEVSNEHAQDIPHFTKICDQMEDGGVEAMLYDLLRWDYTQVELRAAPKTTGLANQVSESLDKPMSFWQEVLTRGYLLSHRETGEPALALKGKATNIWPEAAWKYEIYKEFENFCKYGIHTEDQRQFWRKTYKFWDDCRKLTSRPRDRSGKQNPKVEMPSLENMRRKFTAYTGVGFHEDEVREPDVEVPF